MPDSIENDNTIFTIIPQEVVLKFCESLQENWVKRAILPFRNIIGVSHGNSENLRNTFKQIPLDRLLVETDSPYLAPVPNRGKTNEPSFIIHTIKKLCEIHDIKYDEMCSLTTMNFKNLFKRIDQ